MTQPPSFPPRDDRPPLDYAHRYAAGPLTTGTKVGVFLASGLLVPLALASGILGAIALPSRYSAGSGAIGLAIAGACVWGLFAILRDPRRRGVAIAGGMTGVGVVVLLVGACFALVASAMSGAH